MYYVYIIKSVNFPKKIYIGYTLDIESRVKKHNEGGSEYTKDYYPWNLIYFSAFIDQSTALNFEKYLKSHSGRAFALKRLYQSS